MRIDSHQHFWKTARGDYHWMSPAVPVLYRDYLPEDLKPLLAKNKVEKTILVQAAQTRAETNFLLELAEQNDFIAGVIGWLDMEDPGFPRELDLYSSKPKFLGIRPMLQDIADDRWILRPRVAESLRLVAERGLPFEFLTYPRHLPHVLAILETIPNLRAVLDHISKPEIRHQKLEPWRSFMAEVGKHQNVYCKLSGMITEADHKTWTPEQLRPYIEAVVESFGFERVMFGSDWSVCLLAGSYDDALGALETVLKPRINEQQLGAVFGGNAVRFYEL